MDGYARALTLVLALAAIGCGGSVGEARPLPDDAAADAGVPADAGTVADVAAPTDATTAGDATIAEGAGDASPFTDDYTPPLPCDAGWTWSNPVGVGSTISGMWGASASDVWAVGDLGTILHWNGVAWSPVNSGTSAQLFAVSGTGPNDVWAAGDGPMLHWGGHVWEPIPSGTTARIFGVWAAAPDDAWAVGDYGVSVHWDGHRWSAVPTDTSATLSGVWGTSASDVWAVGDEDTTIHWDGTAWTPGNSNERGDMLYSVWTSSPQRGWAVGAFGTVLSGDGSGWGPLPEPYVFGTDGPTIYAVRGTGPSDVWAVGDGLIAHWDGSQWTANTPAEPGPWFAVWPSNTGDVWTGGARGALIHGDGTTWTPAAGFGTVTDQDLRAVWASADDDAWAVGAGTVLHWNGTSWSSLAPPRPSGDPLGIMRAVWGSGRNDVYMGGDGQGAFYHWDGSAWTQVTAAAAMFADSEFVAGISGSGPNDVDVIGSQGNIIHWDGTEWSFSALYNYNLGQPAGSGPNDVWVAAGDQLDDGAVLHWDGRAVTLAFRGTQFLWDTLAVQSPTNVWAVQQDLNRVLHWDGSEWSDVAIDAGPAPGLPLWPAAPNDVWAAPADSTATNGPSFVHWDGSAWASTSLEVPDAGTSFQVSGLWGSAPNDIWASDFPDGVMAHWDGNTWSIASSPPQPVSTLWGSGPTDLWGLGDEGAVLRWNGSTWSTALPDLSQSPVSIAGSGPNDVWLGTSMAPLHWDGSTWSPVPVPPTTGPCPVWANTANDAWATTNTNTTDQGGLLRWNGTTWSPVLVGMYGPSSSGAVITGDRIWASGSGGAWAINLDLPAVLRQTSGVWAVAAGVPAQTWSAVGGSAQGDVWLVGAQGAAAHWDGAQFTEHDLRTALDLDAVAAIAPNDAWAVGAAGAMAHWDGTSWTSSCRLTTNDLYGVAASPGFVWAIGQNGTILRHAR